MLVLIQCLDVHLLAHTDPLVEEDYFFFRSQSLKRVRDLDIYLKLDDFTELAHCYIIRYMEAEEELADDALVLNYLRID